MNSFAINLISQPQTLTVSLSGTVYKLKVFWNPVAEVWSLDILDSQGVLIAGGLPMVAGVDILGQLSYLGIGGALVVQSSGGDPLAPPTSTNLGQTANLYFVPFSA